MSFRGSPRDRDPFDDRGPTELERIAARMQINVTSDDVPDLLHEHDRQVVAMEHIDGTEYLLGDSDGVLWIGACGGVLWTP